MERGRDIVAPERSPRGAPPVPAQLDRFDPPTAVARHVRAPRRVLLGLEPGHARPAADPTSRRTPSAAARCSTASSPAIPTRRSAAVPGWSRRPPRSTRSIPRASPSSPASAPSAARRTTVRTATRRWSRTRASARPSTTRSSALPLRLFPSLEGVYLARLVSGVIAAALVATAVQLAVAARSRFLVAGVAVALTPIAAFLSGVINPSALEISAALLVWVSGLLIVRPVDLPPWLSRRLIWHFAVASALFVVSRQLSPLFLACIVAVLRGGRTVAAAARGRHRPADLGGRRRGHRRHAVRHVVLRRLPRR